MGRGVARAALAGRVRVYVDVGTKGGLSSRRVVPFCAVISSSSSGCHYGVSPFAARQLEQPVPASAFSKLGSWLADAALRSRGHIASQHKSRDLLVGCGEVRREGR
jgi:Cft2 family RNA processing exonuclease